MLHTLETWKNAAPAAGAILAALSAIVALAAFHYTRRVNRRRATLDMVLKTFIDDGGQKRYNDFKGVMQRHKDPQDDLNILIFADPNCPPSPERQMLRIQLNEYELISLGIKRGLFEEKLYKAWFQDQFQRDFESLDEYIRKVRDKRPSVFCECVWLYTRWKKVPHPENAPSKLKVIWWTIRGNTTKLKAYAQRLKD